MKKIAVVSGTRAEYGLLAPLMHAIRASIRLELQVLVTGSHLLPEFGLTVQVIERDGFTVDRRIPEISSAADGRDVAHQVGKGTIAFATALEELEPDAVVILGDRYEMFAATSAAFFLGIPILHLHGGELTRGAFDDSIRHAISQLAQHHAVAAPEYRDRLIRAGAHPGTVHVVGGLGVDSLNQISLIPREELELELDVEFSSLVFLVTYHPVTRGERDTAGDVNELIAALDFFPDATMIFTMPNTDPEHQRVVEVLERQVANRHNWFLFSALGSANYLSIMAIASVVIGNSSSGLTEAPSLGTPTVNVGSRQEGRLSAKSVISCPTKSSEIVFSIRQALSDGFVTSIQGAVSPYGLPGAAARVLQILETTFFDNLGEKEYYDLPDDS